MVLYFLPAAILACAAFYFLFRATTLAFRADRRSHPEFYKPGAPARRLNMLAIAINWKIAKDPETQSLRRGMNLHLLAALLAAVVAGLLVSLGARS
jgi:hypothetical protein